MAESDFTVYLEHQIERVHLDREEILHQQTNVPIWRGHSWPKCLTIQDLCGHDSRTHLMKKPDTQRATGAWTPEVCVGLLESILNEQDVPGVILWQGPDDGLYVVDGGHRISTLISWVKDDWGDNLPSEAYADETHESASKAAARRVRELLKERGIGFFGDYQAAHARYEELERELGRQPRVGEMDDLSLCRAEMARRWKLAETGLPILWLKGDYAQAEAALLSYLEEFSRLRTLHHDIFDTPEFQEAHAKLMERFVGEAR